MRRGLALEGGGARGAYHIGVVKALFENGFEFDGFVGTSIGAVNAAALAQGDFAKALDFWLNISPVQFFEEDDIELLKFFDIRHIGLSTRLTENLKEALAKIKSGGLSTVKMKRVFEDNLNEARIRSSGKDFGLATLIVNEVKPLRLMLEDIPQGQLINYIMASASLPGFQSETIGEKIFLDGGFYDNCPYSLLLDKGYDEVIAIRTNSFGVFRKVTDPDRVKVIAPKKQLGSMLEFSSESSRKCIDLGYHDGLMFVSELAV